MKIEKIIKYLFVTPVVLFFMCVLFATPVKAESNDTYIFTVPTNTVSYYSFMKDMSIFDYYVFVGVLNGRNFTNINGKRVITGQDSVVDGVPHVKFSLTEGSTEEECIFAIPEAIKNDLYNVGYYVPSRLLNYDYVKVEFKEYDNEYFDGKLVVDFSNFSSILENNYVAMEMISNNISAFNPNGWTDTFRSLDNKLLVTYRDNQFTVSDGVTSADDIIYNITQEDVSQLNYYLGIDNADQYSRLVLKVSGAEYNNASDLVLDFTNSTIAGTSVTNRYRFSNVWHYLYQKGVAGIDSRYCDLLYDNKKILTIIFDETYLMPNSDLTYQDNITFDLDEVDPSGYFNGTINAFYGHSLDELIFVFKQPEFIKGANQEFNTSNGDILSFRLNIPLDKFQESGAVYIDDELVDPSNYLVSEGSTIITFKDSFVKTLGNNNHEINVVVSDGEAVTSFSLSNGNNTTVLNPITLDKISIYLLMFFMSFVGFLFIQKQALRKD